MSKLKKIRKKYASLEYREAHAEEHTITWAQPPRRTYRLV